MSTRESAASSGVAAAPIATEQLSHRSPRFRGWPTLTWTDTRGPQRQRLTSDGLIGSSPESQVVVAHRTVSRVHAEITIKDDGVWVRDLHSRNGTYVSGLRVHGSQLPSNAILKLGAVEVRVEYTDDARVEVDLWESSSYCGMSGDSSAMRELFATLACVSRSDAPALVHGETGTGKELVARAIHEQSARRESAFVVIDCGAFTDSLLDAELFGYAKGAFTGAAATHIGAFESANGGTVFLDEIGELPLSIQPKLLRVLEAKTVRRLGEVAHRPVDVRVVTASHRDLPAMVARGAFREDLYFRLAVLPVAVPPLRERGDDVALLLREFANRSPHAFVLDSAVLRELCSWAWPGNVRQLRNFVERAKALGLDAAVRSASPTSRSTEPPPALSASLVAAALGTGAALAQPAALQDEAHTRSSMALEPWLASLVSQPFREFREAWSEEGERRYLSALLAAHRNDAVAVAKAAGVDKSYIYKMLRRLGMQA